MLYYSSDILGFHIHSNSIQPPGKWIYEKEKNIKETVCRSLLKKKIWREKKRRGIARCWGWLSRSPVNTKPLTPILSISSSPHQIQIQTEQTTNFPCLIWFVTKLFCKSMMSDIKGKVLCWDILAGRHLCLRHLLPSPSSTQKKNGKKVKITAILFVVFGLIKAGD